MLLLLALPLFAHAEWGKFEFDFDEQKPWEELQAQLPPYPKAENQQPFYVSGIAGNEYAVDKATLSVGGDGVVRYVLTVKTRGGAKNVSFEGIRCASRERKIYAIGRNDGSWGRARDDKWVPIAARSLLSHHRALADEYFCPQGVIVHSVDEALRNMRSGW